MNATDYENLGRRLLSGDISLEAFRDELAEAAVCAHEAADAEIDLDRLRRCGYPEVVFGQGKSTDSLVGIFQTLLQAEQSVFATRIEAEKGAFLQQQFPEARYNELARTLRIDVPRQQQKPPVATGRVGVVTAGTSDLPVAAEASETLRWMNVEVIEVNDVGVAGPHRFPQHLEELQGVQAIVVVAGMEGALPSVVGGYMACPVVAVPTSVGYGASLGGLAALLGMLNSCAANVTVVNIDAGFKAGYVAGLIATQASRSRSE